MRSTSSAAYVTAVLRFLQAYNAGDFDAIAELLEPDVEWHGVTSHIGREDVRDYLEAFHGRWGRSHVRPEDFRESGGRVLIVVAFWGDSAHTSRPLQEHQSWICSVSEEGSIQRVLVYPTPADAVRALEETAPA